MSKHLMVAPLLAVVFSSCGINQTLREMHSNTQAIERSTYVICENIRAIEEANKKIAENRQRIEAINETLKSTQESL